MELGASSGKFMATDTEVVSAEVGNPDDELATIASIDC